MRYWFFVLIGLAVCAACIVAIDWGMYHLMRTGTCASGGPYVSARPCPPGTGGHILALIGGVFASFIGMGLYAARGRSETRRESPYPLSLAMWSLLFCTLAGAGLYAVYGPAAPADAPKGTAIFLAALFIPMGLAPIPFGFARGKKSERAAELVQHGMRCRGVVVSVEDTNWTVNDNPRVKLTVRAEPDGDQPFTIEKTAVVSRVKIPQAGDTCTVFYDPTDPAGKNGITFDPIPATATSATATTATAATAAATATPAALDPRAEQAQRLATDLKFSAHAHIGKRGDAPDEDEDPLEKIEKLGELRDKGLITAAEFDEQKARLLREV